MTLLETLIEYCVSKGILVGDGEDSFRDYKPEVPDNAVMFYEYTSDAPIPMFTEHVHRSVQIQIRNKTAEGAKAKAFELYNAFQADSENLRVDFSDEVWGQVYIRELPFKLEQDSSDRVIYCFDLGITTNILE